MKKYKWILFDLDGTLTESHVGIVNATIYALKRFGIEETDREKLLKFVGPPLEQSFAETYGFSPKKAWDAVGVYREYYQTKGKYENKPYPTIDQMLVELKKGGFSLAVATSKPEVMAVDILNKYDLAQYFDVICGAAMDGSKNAKADIMQEAMNLLGATKEQTLMVGDRKFDVGASKTLGVDSIGVLYGYGDEQELIEHGATYIASCPLDVCKIANQN
ncbi:MAG: HAD hydrolase-like protein [Clostridia bacterium]|nr:HAD hydrolase-like protein [Clostridia bacterium]